MDDFTWQQKIQDRRRRRQRDIFLLASVIACLLGTAIWYFRFYQHTPAYAMKQAVAAVEAHDVEKFKKYVNLPLLTSLAYDDLTLDLFAYDATLTEDSKVKFEKFYILVKPQLAGGTESVILRRVESGAWSLPSGTDILKGRQLGIDYERFLARSLVRNTTFLEVAGVHRDGMGAVAEVKVREEDTGTPFTLDLALEQAKEGHWQIAYIKNYRAYLDAIAPRQNRDIADYIAATKDIVAAYNVKFNACRERFAATTVTKDGRLTEGQAYALASMLEKEVIPALKSRQEQLDAVPVPDGARYLAAQRRESTETTIAAWEHFIEGLRTGSPAEYAQAEVLHKRELAIDMRVEDIIRHTAISKDIPNIP